MDLSQKITNASDLRKLANDLRIEQSIVDSELNNHPTNINEAAYRVLSKWFKSQENSDCARKTLCDALRSANMNLHVDTVLK